MPEVIQTPQNPLEILPQHLQSIAEMTNQLRIIANQPGDPAAQKGAIYQNLHKHHDSLEDRRQSGEQVDMYGLAFFAEAAGAGVDPANAEAAMDQLRNNTLLNDQQKAELSGIKVTLWEQRVGGVPERAIAGALTNHIMSKVETIDQSMSKGGPDETAYKIALLGFGTGATLTQPDLPLAGAFMDTLATQVVSPTEQPQIGVPEGLQAERERLVVTIAEEVGTVVPDLQREKLQHANKQDRNRVLDAMLDGDPQRRLPKVSLSEVASDEPIPELGLSKAPDQLEDPEDEAVTYAVKNDQSENVGVIVLKKPAVTIASKPDKYVVAYMKAKKGKGYGPAMCLEMFKSLPEGVGLRTGVLLSADGKRVWENAVELGIAQKIVSKTGDFEGYETVF